MTTHAPKTGRLVEQIRSDIQSGRYGPGDKLPSQRDLEAATGVSRITVRAAYRHLEAEGLVERRPSVGAFVRAVPASPPPQSAGPAERDAYTWVSAARDLALCSSLTLDEAYSFTFYLGELIDPSIQPYDVLPALLQLQNAAGPEALARAVAGLLKLGKPTGQGDGR